VCGIVGFLDKANHDRTPVGRTIVTMLEALHTRGPDSTGAALYGPKHENELVLRVALRGSSLTDALAKQITELVRKRYSVRDSRTIGQYVRLVVDSSGDTGGIAKYIESAAEGAEVVSMGHSLEIIKQVGSPEALDKTYRVSDFLGTHGIGHARLATESAVDLSHSQPFWSHGHTDLAVAHNGHITNYHKLRRLYEQRGIRFYTENDSEVIGIYLGLRLSEGMSLKEAMTASVSELDGSFSYLASTADEMGFARDRFAFKPLLLVETDAFVAVATEEIAIRAAFEGGFRVREAQAREVRVWQRSSATEKAPAKSTLQ
jgi:glutamate synthase domain-containing protein 1